MELRPRTYQIDEIPDPSYFSFWAAANGDVRTAIQEAGEQFLRTLSFLPPGSVTVELRFDFRPTGRGRLRSTRLGLFIQLIARDPTVFEGICSLVEGGPLHPFYGFRPISGQGITEPDYSVLCDIRRYREFLEPLVSPELNAQVPSSYLLIRPLKPRVHNDYWTLDRVLDQVTEPVVVRLRIEPVEVADERLIFARYLARLEAINRSRWDVEEETEGLPLDFLAKDTAPSFARSKAIKPLHRRDPLADELRGQLRDFHETLFVPNLRFNLQVLATREPVARLLGSVVANLAFAEGSFHLRCYSRQAARQAGLVGDELDLRVGSLHDMEASEDDQTHYGNLVRLSHMATVEELQGAFRLPVASSSSPCCIRKNTDPPELIDRESRLVFGHETQEVGNSTAELSTPVRGITLRQLTKHLFISGLPGSGKTVACQHLMIQLYAQGVPFLVIEPVKTEYRRLKAFQDQSDPRLAKLAQDLEVYTLGDETLSPFRLNPLEILPGTFLDEHLENLLACFLAAMPVGGPLPALLGEALERVYTENSQREYPPVLVDLVAAAQAILAEKKYSGSTHSDLSAALETRIGMLIRRGTGRIFQCPQSRPGLDHLMSVPTILEMDRLHRDQACLLTLFILTAIRESLKTLPSAKGQLRYVIFIEEAHNIVGQEGNAQVSEVAPDPRAHVADFICRMLAELRALGVGIVIVDQLPSAVASEVIKNTATKLAFRQVANTDREELGGTMLFGPMEMAEIARLQTGEAFFSTEGYYRPQRIRTVDWEKDLVGLSDSDFKAFVLSLQNEAWFRQRARERAGAELHHLRSRLEEFNRRRITLVSRGVELLGRHPLILATRRGQMRTSALAALAREARNLQDSLKHESRRFQQGSYSTLLTETWHSAVDEDLNLHALRSKIVSCWEDLILPDLQQTQNIMDRLIQRCNTS